MGKRARKVGKKLNRSRFGKKANRRAKNYKPGKVGRAVQKGLKKARRRKKKK